MIIWGSKEGYWWGQRGAGPRGGPKAGHALRGIETVKDEADLLPALLVRKQVMP